LAEGPLSLAIVSGAFGAEAGGLIGGALDESIEQQHAEYLEEQLSHGGLLLWVRISDGDQEKLAREILSRHSGRDVYACNYRNIITAQLSGARERLAVLTCKGSVHIKTDN